MNKNYLTVGLIGLLLVVVTAISTYQITIRNFKVNTVVKDSVVYLPGTPSMDYDYKYSSGHVQVESDSTKPDVLKCDSTIVDDSLDLKIRVYTEDFKNNGVSVDWIAKLEKVIVTKVDTLVKETFKMVPVPQYRSFFGIEFYTGTILGTIGGVLIMILVNAIGG